MAGTAYRDFDVIILNDLSDLPVLVEARAMMVNPEGRV